MIVECYGYPEATPPGFESQFRDAEKLKHDAALARIPANAFGIPVPLRSVPFRPVPPLDAESRQPDGNGIAPLGFRPGSRIGLVATAAALPYRDERIATDER